MEIFYISIRQSIAETTYHSYKLTIERKIVPYFEQRKIRFHDLRHTNATLLLEEGATLKEVQDWMGHKSFSTTADTYAHVQHKTKTRLAESIGGLLSNG